MEIRPIEGAARVSAMQGMELVNPTIVSDLLFAQVAFVQIKIPEKKNHVFSVARISFIAAGFASRATSQ
jgi:hypothetical protein